MKKIKLLLLAVLLSVTTAFAQPVSDMGAIPIGVSLNSILRLNVLKGGNIEFVVNTFDQFNKGIGNSPAYDTHFTVASSTDFDVRIEAETALLYGQLDVAHEMDVKNIGYIITEEGSYADPANWDLQDALTALTSTSALIVTGTTSSAGTAAQNHFVINWELATANVLALGTLGTLLAQDLETDRYVVNVFINAVRK